MINIHDLKKHINVELIIQHLACIGFGVPNIAIENIESIRDRRPEEKKYTHYLQEKFLESLSFSEGKWSRKARQVVNLSYRSEYLDMLCENYNDYIGIFGSDNKDATDVYESLFDQDADPNILIYSRMDYTDFSKSKHIHDLESKRLIVELEFFQEIVNKVTQHKNNLSKQFTLSLLEKVSDIYGIKLSKWENSNVIASLEIQLCRDYSLYCDWSDSFVLSKWGQLMLEFRLDLSNSQPTSNAIRKNFDCLLPDSGVYFKTNKEINRVALAFILIAKTFVIIQGQ